MSLRTRAGALLYDWPRFLYASATGRWWAMRNRGERVSRNSRGVRCEWQYTSDLHLARISPTAGARLMKLALAEWPMVFRDAPSPSPGPVVSFVIGHRGLARVPHLLATLRSIAGQAGAAIECIVVEQSREPEIAGLLPSWVHYLHTPIPTPGYDYNRAWTLNAGVEAATGDIVVLHDNDMLVPSGYAAELLDRRRAGGEFFELKRFTFYLSEADTAAFFASHALPVHPSPTIVQNLLGASVGAVRAAYLAIGGFDEEFVGWGGEDNDFWDRALTTGKVDQYGRLPMIHLFHAPQPGKLLGAAAPAVQRYEALRRLPPDKRIELLLQRRRAER